MSAQPEIHACFEPKTSTWQYVVADPETKAAVIIDPVLDFDPGTNTISTASADALLAFVDKNGYTVHKLLETHAHADHLTAAKYLQQKLLQRAGSKADLCIGKRIGQVQRLFAKRYGIAEEEYEAAFDRLFDDNEEFPIGNLNVKVLYLPGHTPDHIGYQIGDNVFTGDSIFDADVGSARCDFPGGDATNLYNSAKTLLSLPLSFRLYSGHDYPPGGEGRKKPLAFMTVAEQNESNKHLKAGVVEEDFVKWRTERDAALAEPRLIHQALQFNIRAGQLPRPTEHGYRLLHVPLKVAESTWTWGDSPQG